jgi:hypothetical protein
MEGAISQRWLQRKQETFPPSWLFQSIASLIIVPPQAARTADPSESATRIAAIKKAADDIYLPRDLKEDHCLLSIEHRNKVNLLGE